ncbi:septal ring lytic transglycosylase RlpA family protein [Krasilnikovia cinnamomea]|nr:septal ring lytic transglycosylase RlpA family protein [Krasilnikovia cinnamomea]
MTGRARKLMIGAAAATLVGGAFAISTGISSAGENCGGLDQALQNNLNFIAGQKANPDAQSDARIANRQAVVDLIQQRRAAAGCTADVAANNGNAGQGNGNAGNGNAGQGRGSGESCAGLDKALQNNLNFIAGQKANPDAQSDARIANRQAVVDLIQQRRAAAGCNGNAGAGNGNAGQGNGNAGNGNNGNAGQGNNGNAGQGNNGNAGQGNNGNAGQGNNGNAGQGNNGNAGQGNNGNAGNGAGEVVCANQQVTTTGSGGSTALSGTFPVGTKLKVTNQANNKSVTVEVEGPSGSCVLLNEGAFAQIREPGKQLVRQAVVERVG